MPVLPDLPSILADAGGAFGWIVGTSDGATYTFARWCFLRGLGAVYLVAFVSLWTQVEGLIGEDGILPAREHLASLRRSGTGTGLLTTPTVFWVSAGDAALHAACAAGVALSLLLVVGVAPPVVLLGLWALYLSFAAVGRVFLSYQWDVLLVEAGFLAVFVAPWGLATGPLSAALSAPTSPVGIFLVWWLLFRLVFQSGVGKLTSGDTAWRDLSALRYHWWTQPLPAWPAWWLDKLPDAFHRGATLATHVLEVAVPLLIFGPREARLAAFAGIVLLQLAILATGNYNFFNLLTVVLALLLVDDAAWRTLLGAAPVAAVTDGGPAGTGSPARTAAGLAFAVPALLVGGAHLWRTLSPDRPLPRVLRRLIRSLQPFRTINSYGLFRVMTKRRPEIVVQGSRDGETWRDYTFRWKPGDPRRRPRFCAPHQPRLDWQMWFAALGSFRRSRWLRAFLSRLLRRSPAVEQLLEDVPFRDDGPRYVRAVLYEYRFTSRRERRDSGRWWSRTRRGLYAPPLALDDD